MTASVGSVDGMVQVVAVGELRCREVFAEVAGEAQLHLEVSAAGPVAGIPVGCTVITVSPTVCRQAPADWRGRGLSCLAIFGR